jgi:hypothetical protein
MQHSFDIEIAKKYGDRVAIFLNNIAFWLHKNITNKRHFYDNYHWTYNSQEAFLGLFPYWTRQNLRTIIKKCVDEDLIKIGNYNETTYDRTSWYALSSKGLELFPILKSLGCNQPIEVMKSTETLVETNQPIPDSKPDIKHKERVARKKREPLSDNFIFDDENQKLCYERRLNWKNVQEKFKANAKSKGIKSEDWQSEAKLWIMNEKQTIEQKDESVRPRMRDFTQERLDREAQQLKGKSHGSEIRRDNARGNNLY